MAMSVQKNVLASTVAVILEVWVTIITANKRSVGLSVIKTVVQ